MSDGGDPFLLLPDLFAELLGDVVFAIVLAGVCCKRVLRAL